MKLETTNRGFRVLLEEKYQNERGHFTRLLQESSGIGNHEDSFIKPGSSFLWVGEDHHLNREQVRELIRYLQNWSDTGKLAEPKDHDER